MKILVACEESQAVTIELRRLGHEAYSCDIEPCSGGHPEWHIYGDALRFLEPCMNWLPGEVYGYGIAFSTMDDKRHFVADGWDMLIAFPPCTYLSNAGACRLYPKKGQLDPERYKKGLEAKEFFLKFLNADCPKIAVENPVSSRVFEMPKHSQEIEPWMFGHPCTKKTRLWLRGLPPLKPTNVVAPIGPYCPSKTSRKQKSCSGSAKRGNDAKERAKTFKGVARAMAEQWCGVCTNK